MIPIFRTLNKITLLLAAALFAPWLPMNAEEYRLNNPGLDSNESKVAGWNLSNAAPVFTDDGKTAVKLPAMQPKKYAKVYQRLAIDGETVGSIRLGATVRCIPRATPNTGSKPILRFLYFPKVPNWKFPGAIWPTGRDGARFDIPYREGWQQVFFEMPCPKNARFIEVCVEAENPDFFLEIDGFTLEVRPRS